MPGVPEVARVATLAGMTALVVAALWLRGRASWPLEHPKKAGTLVVVAMLTGAAAYAWLVLPLIASLPRQPIVAGAVIGWMFGGIPVAMALPVIAFLVVIDRAMLPRIDDPLVLIWTSLAGIVGFAAAGILFVQFVFLIRWAGRLAFLLVPLGIALFPLVHQVFWAPALLAALRRRQRHVEPSYAEALRAWIRDVGETYRLEKIELLFGPAKHWNAAAIGFWPFTRFIMIGDGLTSAMDEREARAILAHEVAHVLRNDVRNQLLVWIGLGTAWVCVWAWVTSTFGLRGPWWAMAGGTGWGAVMYVAGRYSRHCELATDRLGSELTGDADGLAAALTRLAEVTKTPARRSPTHPSLNERLTNLRRASSSTPRASGSRTTRC